MCGSEEKLNNKGFSLIEMIVAVLIIGILSSGAVLAMSLVYNADAERSAKNLCNMLTQTRQSALALADTDSVSSAGSSTVYLKLRFDGSDYYADIFNPLIKVTKTTLGDGSRLTTTELVSEGDAIASKKLGNYRITVSYSTDKGVTKTQLPGDNSLVIRFNKSTGGIAEAYTVAADGSRQVTGIGLTDIYIDGSGSEHIIVVRETGRFYLQ